MWRHLRKSISTSQDQEKQDELAKTGKEEEEALFSLPPTTKGHH